MVGLKTLTLEVASDDQICWTDGNTGGFEGSGEACLRVVGPMGVRLIPIRISYGKSGWEIRIGIDDRCSVVREYRCHGCQDAGDIEDEEGDLAMCPICEGAPSSIEWKGGV